MTLGLRLDTSYYLYFIEKLKQRNGKFLARTSCAYVTTESGPGED